jgi:hypothetical protein
MMGGQGGGQGQGQQPGQQPATNNQLQQLMPNSPFSSGQAAMQQRPPMAMGGLPGMGQGGGQQQIDPQMIMQLLQMLGMGGGGIR